MDVSVTGAECEDEIKRLDIQVVARSREMIWPAYRLIQTLLRGAFLNIRDTFVSKCSRVQSVGLTPHISCINVGGASY